MCSSSFARTVLISINLLFWLAGGCLLGLGVWMKVDPTIVNYLNVVHLDHTKPALLSHAASMFIIVGAFVFAVSFLGCFGALRRNQGMLFLYAIFVFFAIFAEIIASILVIVYWQKVQEFLLMGMTAQVKYYYFNGTAMYDTWNFLQATDKCCGASNYKDYVNTGWYNSTDLVVPPSCCVPDNVAACEADAAAFKEESDYLYTAGCASVVIAWFQSHSIILTVCGFLAGLIQILGFTGACVLRQALRRDKV